MKSLYNPYMHPRAARALAAEGKIGPEIAKCMGVSPRTLTNWALKYTEFADALAEGKHGPDEEVEAALFDRARGYDYREEVVDRNGDVHAVKRHLPPDTAACKFWLTNRKGEVWKHVRAVESVQNVEALVLQLLRSDSFGVVRQILAEAARVSPDLRQRAVSALAGIDSGLAITSGDGGPGDVRASGGAGAGKGPDPVPGV